MSHSFLCSSCDLPMSGQYDCGTPVASKYFPIVNSSGKAYPLCERHYFARLDLICARCGEAIHGSYINALGKKFHVDHFSCSLCLTPFGPNDAYYEHQGHIYCHYHFSELHASKCVGCHMVILKQYVDITRNGIEEQWHLECYMVQKVWNITLNSIQLNPKLNEPPTNPTELLSQSQPNGLEHTFSKANGVDAFTLASEKLKHEQKAMEELVSRVWSVLSIFEESAAACISNMLLNVSNGLYLEGVRQAASFILHIEVLFAGIDLIDQRLAIHLDHMGLVYAKEPKFLCKKVIGFFALLSHTQKTGIKRLEITQELLSLVTSLAHSLKCLIRLSLSGALKLEREYNSPGSLSAFLDTLLELSEQDGRIQLLLDTEAIPERCLGCQSPIEEACISSVASSFTSTLSPSSCRWHLNCFSCIRCQKLLSSDLRSAAGWQPTEPQGVLCSTCFSSNQNTPCEFERVTSLSQYIFLLRVSLQRLLVLFNVKNNPPTLPSTHPDLTTTPTTPPLVTTTAANFPPLSTSSSPSVSEELDNKLDNETGVQRDLEVSLIPETKSVDSQSPIWLSELSVFEFYLLRHVVVGQLETLLQWSSEEMLPLIDEGKKPGLWNRFVHTILKKGKPKEEGTFSVALESLVAKTGVASTLGAGPGQILLPAFIDTCIGSLRASDLHVEGIFRKNGNIKRLNQVRELFDLDPMAGTQSIREESPIQIAALLKKFLRELPEPLLTYRLYKVFVVASSTWTFI
ncbi:hypothetical protein HMI55_003181 [Coelomomyces lativittatus]|nr:hypothetical protein HMI55_003181 [Coelomomyces lativittatus]